MAIQIDYDNARANAKKLQSAADVCAAAARSMQSSAEGISGFWRGGAANLFTQMAKQWGANTYAIEKELDTLAAQITKAANDMEQKEKELAAAARSAAQFAAKTAQVKSAHPSGSAGAKDALDAAKGLLSALGKGLK